MNYNIKSLIYGQVNAWGAVVKLIEHMKYSWRVYL